jgi:subtilisin family serine protease
MELGGNMLLISSEYGKIAYYENLESVVSVTPNSSIYQAGVYDSAPNDVDYTNQSSVFTATRLQGAWQAIEDYAAENSITPSTVKIAVLDTGVDGTHDDLAGRIIDGYDAVNGVPLAGDENTDISAVNHGTKVAGIIAASAYNEIGIAGVAGCFPVSIMPVRVLNEEGRGDIADVVKGIYWAIENGADIINLSFAAPLNYYPYALGKATAAAHDAGILVLAAAGNYGDTVSDY